MSTVLGLALGGGVVLALSIGLRLRRLVIWGLALIVAAYAVWLPDHRDPQAAVLAPLFAAGVLTAGEGAFAAIERRIDPLWLLGTFAAGVFAAGTVLVLAAIPIDRSVGMTVAGTGTVITFVVLIRALMRRRVG